MIIFFVFSLNQKSAPFEDWCIAPFYYIRFSSTKVSIYNNTGDPSFYFRDFQITTQEFSDKPAICCSFPDLPGTSLSPIRRGQILPGIHLIGTFIFKPTAGV